MTHGMMTSNNNLTMTGAEQRTTTGDGDSIRAICTVGEGRPLWKTVLRGLTLGVAC